MGSGWLFGGFFNWERNYWWGRILVNCGGICWGFC